MNTRLPNKTVYILAPMAVSIITTAVFQQWLNANLQGQLKYITHTSLIVFYLLSILSYYQSCKISNKQPHYIVLPKKKNHLPKYNHYFYFNEVNLLEGGRYKSTRTLNCPNCGPVLRMDQHCPWVGQCIGLRNSRAFTLFCLYTSLIALQYAYSSIRYYRSITSEQYQELGRWLIISWIAMSFLSFMFIISLVSLTFLQIYMAAFNITTSDTIHGQFGLNPNKKKPNPADLGCFTNLALFFQYDTFWWWFPFARLSKNDGICYELRPPVKQGQLPNSTGLQESYCKTLSQLHCEYDQYYKKTTFSLDGKNYNLIQSSKQDKQNQETIKDL